MKNPDTYTCDICHAPQVEEKDICIVQFEERMVDRSWFTEHFCKHCCKTILEAVNKKEM